MAWPPASDLVLEFAPGTPPNEYPRTWVDITEYLKGPYWRLSTRRGRSFVLDQPQAGRMTVVLDNSDGRFTPENPNSPYYPDLITDVPIRAHMSQEFVTDSFSRSASGGLGTADSGQAWTHREAAYWNVGGGVAYVTQGQDNWAVVDSGYSTGIEISVRFVTVEKGQRLSWRHNADYQYFFIDGWGGAGAWNIWRWNGFLSSTFIGDIALTPTAGDVVTVRLDGSTHIILINGREEFSFTDSTYLAATRHGLAKHGDAFTYSADGYWDNFSISDPASLFEGYIESYAPEWPDDDVEGICTIEAVDGLGPMALDIPASREVFDTFTRADHASSWGDAESGQTWAYANSNGANLGTFSIESGKGKIAMAHDVAFGRDRTIATVDVGKTDVNVRVSYPAGQSVTVYAGDGPFIAFRYVDEDNFWFFAISGALGAQGFYVLGTVIGGVYGVAAQSGPGAFTEFPGTTISVEADGDDITAVVNTHSTTPGNPPETVELSARAGASDPNGTKVGLGQFAYNNPSSMIATSNYFDDFEVGVNLSAELSGARVNNLLDMLGWPDDLRDIAEGTITLAAKLLPTLSPDATISILSEIQDVVESELGLFYIRADGVAVFEDRNTRLDSTHTTSRGTFGNGGGSAVPVTVVQPVMDNARIANYVVVTRRPADIDEVQTVTLAGATGGTFALTYRGYTTADIAYDATAAQVEDALELLTSVQFGNVAVSGSAGGPYAVRFQRDLGAQDVELLVADGALLTGTTPAVTVEETTRGQSEDDTPVSSTASDTDSIDRHRRRPMAKSTQLTSDSDAQTMADLLLNRWKDDHLRIPRLALDWSLPARHTHARKRDISDLVTVSFTPFSTVAQTVAQASFIEGIAHDIDQNRAMTVWDVSPAALSASYWVLENAAFGVLESTTIPA